MMTGVVCASSFLQRQAEIELKELRNKSFFGFFMLNALFVLIVFLLQLNKDELHIDWPLGIRENITIVPNTDEVPYYLWALFFALVLVLREGEAYTSLTSSSSPYFSSSTSFWLLRAGKCDHNSQKIMSYPLPPEGNLKSLGS